MQGGGCASFYVDDWFIYEFFKFVTALLSVCRARYLFVCTIRAGNVPLIPFSGYLDQRFEFTRPFTTQNVGFPHGPSHSAEDLQSERAGLSAFPHLQTSL